MRELLALWVARVLGGIPVTLETTEFRWNEANRFQGRTLGYVQPGDYYLIRRRS